MPFYKRQNEELLYADQFVSAPDYELVADKNETYTYPVDGWYWFATLDEAMIYLRSSSVVVTQRQARLALQQTNMLAAVETWIAAAPDTVRIEWEYANEIRRDWPPIADAAADLGLTEAQLDELFALAATL